MSAPEPSSWNEAILEERNLECGMIAPVAFAIIYPVYQTKVKYWVLWGFRVLPYKGPLPPIRKCRVPKDTECFKALSFRYHNLGFGSDHTSIYKPTWSNSSSNFLITLYCQSRTYIYIYIIIIYIYNVPTQVGLVPTNKLTKGKLPAAKNGSCAIFKQAVSRLKPRFGFFQKDRGKTEIWIYTRIHHSKQIPRGHPSPIRNFYMGPGDQNPLNLKARAACQGHRGENPKNPHKSTLKCWTPPVLRQKFSSFRLKASMESGQLLSHVG